MRFSRLSHATVAIPLYMVALLLLLVPLHAEGSQIDSRASKDPCTIAKMVQVRFLADSFPLLSHGGEWSQPDVAKWLNAAAVVLETEALLTQSAGSFIAALAMAHFDSADPADHADDFSYVGQRLSSSDIRHWLEASSVLLLSPMSDATSFARPVYSRAGTLATQGIGADGHTSAQASIVANAVHGYLQAVTVLLAINVSAINGSHPTSSEQVLPVVNARGDDVVVVPLLDSGGFLAPLALLFCSLSLCVALIVGFVFFIAMRSGDSCAKSIVPGLLIDGGVTVRSSTTVHQLSSSNSSSKRGPPPYESVVGKSKNKGTQGTSHGTHGSSPVWPPSAWGDPTHPVRCSTLPPRGPTCHLPHNGPCWRDPAWAGPLPARVLDNRAAVDAISRERRVQAMRLGEECKHVPGLDLGLSPLTADSNLFDSMGSAAPLGDTRSTPSEVVKLDYTMVVSIIVVLVFFMLILSTMVVVYLASPYLREVFQSILVVDGGVAVNGISALSLADSFTDIAGFTFDLLRINAYARLVSTLVITTIMPTLLSYLYPFIRRALRVVLRMLDRRTIMSVLVALMWMFVIKVSAAPQHAPKQRAAIGNSLVNIANSQFGADFFMNVDTRDERVNALLAELDDLSDAQATRKQAIIDTRNAVVADLNALKALRTAIDVIDPISSHAIIDDSINDFPDIASVEHEPLLDVNFYESVYDIDQPSFLVNESDTFVASEHPLFVDKSNVGSGSDSLALERSLISSRLKRLLRTQRGAVHCHQRSFLCHRRKGASYTKRRAHASQLRSRRVDNLYPQADLFYSSINASSDVMFASFYSSTNASNDVMFASPSQSTVGDVPDWSSILRHIVIIASPYCIFIVPIVLVAAYVGPMCAMQTVSCLLSAVALRLVDDVTFDTSLSVLHLVAHPVDIRAEFLKCGCMALSVGFSLAIVLAHYCISVSNVDFDHHNFASRLVTMCNQWISARNTAFVLLAFLIWHVTSATASSQVSPCGSNASRLSCMPRGGRYNSRTCEAAVALQGNTPQELSTRYRSLVGGLIYNSRTCDGHNDCTGTQQLPATMFVWQFRRVPYGIGHPGRMRHRGGTSDETTAWTSLLWAHAKTIHVSVTFAFIVTVTAMTISSAPTLFGARPRRVKGALFVVFANLVGSRICSLITISTMIAIATAAPIDDLATVATAASDVDSTAASGVYSASIFSSAVGLRPLLNILFVSAFVTLTIITIYRFCTRDRLGSAWVIENPVRRNGPWPWKRFSSETGDDSDGSTVAQSLPGCSDLSTARVCQLDTCQNQCYFDEVSQSFYDYCCHAHGKRAVDPFSASLLPHCQFHNCKRPRYVRHKDGFIYDYCGNTHAKAAAALLHGSSRPFSTVDGVPLEHVQGRRLLVTETSISPPPSPPAGKNGSSSGSDQLESGSDQDDLRSLRDYWPTTVDNWPTTGLGWSMQEEFEFAMSWRRYYIERGEWTNQNEYDHARRWDPFYNDLSRNSSSLRDTQWQGSYNQYAHSSHGASSSSQSLNKRARGSDRGDLRSLREPHIRERINDFNGFKGVVTSTPRDVVVQDRQDIVAPVPRDVIVPARQHLQHFSRNSDDEQAIKLEIWRNLSTWSDEMKHRAEVFISLSRGSRTSPLNVVWNGTHTLAVGSLNRHGDFTALCLGVFGEQRRDMITFSIYGTKVGVEVQRRGIGVRMVKLLTIVVAKDAIDLCATRFSMNLPDGHCHRNLEALILYRKCGWRVTRFVYNKTRLVELTELRRLYDRDRTPPLIDYHAEYLMICATSDCIRQLSVAELATRDYLQQPSKDGYRSDDDEFVRQLDSFTASASVARSSAVAASSVSACEASTWAVSARATSRDIVPVDSPAGSVDLWDILGEDMQQRIISLVRFTAFDSVMRYFMDRFECPCSPHGQSYLREHIVALELVCWSFTRAVRRAGDKVPVIRAFCIKDRRKPEACSSCKSFKTLRGLYSHVCANMREGIVRGITVAYGISTHVGTNMTVQTT